MRTWLSLIILFSMFHLSARAQGGEAFERYQNERLGSQQFEKEEWQKAKEGLDFSEEAVKKKEPPPAPAQEPAAGGEETQTLPSERGDAQINPELAAGILKFLFILVLAVVLALILRGVLGLESIPRNKQIKQENQEKVISLEQIEENIHESDLEAFIRQAFEEEKYSLALRLHYLSILKELSLRKAILWKRDKTNHQYVQEMQQSPHSGAFEEVTDIFEQAWYGGRQLDRREYRALEPKFRILAGKVKGR